MLNRNIKKHPRELSEQQKDSEGAGEGERTAHFLFSLFFSSAFFFSPHSLFLSAWHYLNA